MIKQRIFVGMSGGVDSAVASLILKEQGYDVCCIYMNNWNKKTESCTNDIDMVDAKRISDRLSLEFRVVDFSEEYWNKVFVDFLNEYSLGNTPNPDIFCNSEIKFKAFIEYAILEKAEIVATGHYAISDQYGLRMASDTRKDQTYFLYRLNKCQLSRSIFPIGTMKKEYVREIAKNNNIHVYNKKGTSGICFIGEKRFDKFISKYMLKNPGNIVDKDSRKILGNHNGLFLYTIGQRKNIRLGGSGGAWYVIEKDIDKNELIVSQNELYLYSKYVYFCRQHWISDKKAEIGDTYFAKIRYNQNQNRCIIIDSNIVEFQDKQRAVTNGQHIVFYDNDGYCLGGGIICNQQI